MNHRARSGALGLLVALVVAACSSSSAPADEPSGAPCVAAAPACDGNDATTCVDGHEQRQACGADAYCNYGACTPATIHLPRDAAPHSERTEWWYYTGHVASGAHHWGFEVTIFQYDIAFLTHKPGLGYMCHVAVVDKDAREHYHTDAIAADAKTWASAPIDLEVANCRFELGGDGNDHIRGQIPLGAEKDHKASPWVLDLTVTPQKRPAFHGGDGVIPMAAGGGTSWYYSYTRLGAAGTLSTPEGDFAVTGQAWMDHQWGDFDIQAFKGWDWWSLQFADGHEIMLFQFTDWAGKLASQAGTIVDPAGNLTELDGMASFEVKSLRSWPSPHTDGVYPLDWDLVIPAMDWKVAVRTSVDDQEMYNLAQNYWEGETTLTGTRGGTAVSGVGYTELTGYATDLSDPVKP